MTTLVLTDAYISLDGTEVSSKGNQVSINYEAETHDETAFGMDTRKMKGGLKRWSMDISFHQDFADNDLDEDLFALIGTQVTVAVRPDNTTISTANPEYTGTGLIVGYQPVQGAVGELARTTVRVESAGTLTRDVTP